MIDVKAIRKERGITGAALGEKAGLSVSGLSMIETGHRRPSVDLAKRLGAALGVDWTLFFEDGDTDNDNPPTAAGT